MLKIKESRGDKIRFNLMLVGQNGTGKTSFLASLLDGYASHNFNTYSSEIPAARLERKKGAVDVTKVGRVEVNTESSNSVSIIIYESHGYGDFINNQHAVSTIRDHLMKTHASWRNLDAQTMSAEDLFQHDERIHCVFYFLPAHSMKELDISFLSELSGLVPIIPIVAKADTMTVLERNVYLNTVYETIGAISSMTNSPVVYDFKSVGPTAVKSNIECINSTPKSQEAFKGNKRSPATSLPFKSALRHEDDTRHSDKVNVSNASNAADLSWKLDQILKTTENPDSTILRGSGNSKSAFDTDDPSKHHNSLALADLWAEFGLSGFLTDHPIEEHNPVSKVEDLTGLDSSIIDMQKVAGAFLSDNVLLSAAPALATNQLKQSICLEDFEKSNDEVRRRSSQDTHPCLFDEETFLNIGRALSSSQLSSGSVSALSTEDANLIFDEALQKRAQRMQDSVGSAVLVNVNDGDLSMCEEESGLNSIAEKFQNQDGGKVKRMVCKIVSNKLCDRIEGEGKREACKLVSSIVCEHVLDEPEEVIYEKIYEDKQQKVACENELKDTDSVTSMSTISSPNASSCLIADLQSTFKPPVISPTISNNGTSISVTSRPFLVTTSGINIYPNIFAVICTSDDGSDMHSSPSWARNAEVTVTSGVSNDALHTASASSEQRDSKRVYPWGTVDSSDPTHSDINRLKYLLFQEGPHIKALINLTRQKTSQLFPSMTSLYGYRASQLISNFPSQMGRIPLSSAVHLLIKMFRSFLDSLILFHFLSKQTFIAFVDLLVDLKETGRKSVEEKCASIISMCPAISTSARHIEAEIAAIWRAAMLPGYSSPDISPDPEDDIDGLATPKLRGFVSEGDQTPGCSLKSTGDLKSLLISRLIASRNYVPDYFNSIGVYFDNYINLASPAPASTDATLEEKSSSSNNTVESANNNDLSINGRNCGVEDSSSPGTLVHHRCKAFTKSISPFVGIIIILQVILLVSLCSSGYFKMNPSSTSCSDAKDWGFKSAINTLTTDVSILHRCKLKQRLSGGGVFECLFDLAKKENLSSASSPDVITERQSILTKVKRFFGKDGKKPLSIILDGNLLPGAFAPQLSQAPMAKERRGDPKNMLEKLRRKFIKKMVEKRDQEQQDVDDAYDLLMEILRKKKYLPILPESVEANEENERNLSRPYRPLFIAKTIQTAKNFTEALKRSVIQAVAFLAWVTPTIALAVIVLQVPILTLHFLWSIWRP